MTDKVNGSSFGAEFLTGDMEFWTVKTILDIRPTGVVAAASIVNPAAVYPFEAYGETYSNATEYNNALASQTRFDKLIEIISTRAQPVILGDVTVAVELSPVPGITYTFPPTLSSNTGVTVYTLKFAIEHAKAWDDTTLDLAETLNGVEGFVYTTPTTLNNVYIFKNDLL